jgi:periplasmic protein TonB
MGHSFLHLLNIGTLSTWLSLFGFGTVGILVHPLDAQPGEPAPKEETEILITPIDLGDFTAAALPSNPDKPEPSPELPAEALPAPPELPPSAESEPLPEVPDLPAAAPTPVASTPRETRTEIRRPTTGSAPRATTPSRSGTSSASGSSSSGMSDAARLAAGRMPAPGYPAAARRGGQTGTVVVEFTVDTSGRVISAHASRPSPWPLLNDEAVRTVRRWKFPPGGVMKLQRPIVFQLR